MKHKKEVIKDKKLMKSIKDASKNKEHKLHKKEEKLHHKAEKAMKADEKVHKSIEKVQKKEDKPKKEAKIKKVVKEFEAGKLHAGSKKGPKVKSKAQALAIGYAESRKSAKNSSKKK